MKRLISLIVIGGLVLSLCSCDKEESDRSSQTEVETEAVETTESESVSTETAESEPTESETTETETSETTSEETTISESETETETETEIVKNEGGSIFIDCSGKSADQIAANVLAIRTIYSGDTAESYAERFEIAPQWDSNYDEKSVNVGFIWFSDMVSSKDYISAIRLDSDFESEGGEILIVDNSNAEITIELSDFDTAKEVYEKVSYYLAVDYVRDDDGNYDEADVELAEDDSNGVTMEARYLVRSVSLKLDPNDQGAYVLSIEIDLLGA